jgi:hypothetical protein
MRGGFASDGLRGTLIGDDPLQFGQTRAAIRAGAQGLADFLDASCP